MSSTRGDESRRVRLGSLARIFCVNSFVQLVVHAANGTCGSMVASRSSTHSPLEIEGEMNVTYFIEGARSKGGSGAPSTSK
jgi:hypothetical protein